MWYGTAQESGLFFPPIFYIPDTQQQTQNVGFETLKFDQQKASKMCNLSNFSPVLNYETRIVDCGGEASSLNVMVAFLSATCELAKLRSENFRPYCLSLYLPYLLISAQNSDDTVEA